MAITMAAPAYLKEKFNPRGCDERDRLDREEEAQKDPLLAPERNPLSPSPPKRDMAVKDGDTITLGGLTLKLYVIPGYTLGTLATVSTLHDAGEAHRAVTWGGTAYNFGPLPDQLSTLFRHHVEIPRDHETENADIFLSNHVSFSDSIRAKMEELRARKPASPIHSWSDRMRCSAFSPFWANAHWRPRPVLVGSTAGGEVTQVSSRP